MYIRHLHCIPQEYIDTQVQTRQVSLNCLVRLPFRWTLGCFFSSQSLCCSHQGVFEFSLGKSARVVICLRDILFKYGYQYMYEVFNGAKPTSNHSGFTVVTVRI